LSDALPSRPLIAAAETTWVQRVSPLDYRGVPGLRFELTDPCGSAVWHDLIRVRPEQPSAGI